MDMKCPICCIALKATKRQDVEIAFCPQCHGVWLERGRLDRIIDRTLSYGGEIRSSESGPADLYGRDPKHDESETGHKRSLLTGSFGEDEP